MERIIGETFEYEGKKLKVVETEKNLCFDCYFYNGVNCQKTFRECGKCEEGSRSDHKPIIFVEVKDEQPQEQAEQPQELNLCEILKHCPNGELFWSPLLGDVKLYDIDEEAKTVDVTTKDLTTWEINADGTISIDEVTSPEIMLYPSRTQRDWAKVKYEKKERFDPKTLKAFDRVIVYGKNEGWFCTIFSHIGEGEYPYNTASGNYDWCIPYNDETKHLVGTTDEAPEYYRYWEN